MEGEVGGGEVGEDGAGVDVDAEDVGAGGEEEFGGGEAEAGCTAGDEDDSVFEGLG